MKKQEQTKSNVVVKINGEIPFEVHKAINERITEKRGKTGEKTSIMDMIVELLKESLNLK